MSIRNLLVFAALLLFIASACRQAPVSTENTANENAGATAEATPSETVATGTIDTKEPPEYQAVINLKLETTGTDQKFTIRPVTANFARSGADKRVSFILPDGEEVVYLDKGERRYILLLKRKQYAEVTAETGFEIPTVMTPGQIVERLSKAQGYERVGEEMLGGRRVTKYRYTSTTQTGAETDVKTEALVYVDNETGLPVRSETVAEATSGDVRGIKGLKMIQELEQIRTDIDPNLFEIPGDLKLVDREQMRQQANVVAQAVLAIAQQILSAQTGSPVAPPSPVASPSPAR